MAAVMPVDRHLFVVAKEIPPFPFQDIAFKYQRTKIMHLGILIVNSGSHFSAPIVPSGFQFTNIFCNGHGQGSRPP
jgi:hypothetical protein